MAAKDDLGRAGEQLAVDHLTEHGYTVLDRNWRCPDGELDIVAHGQGDLVVVEVKTRRSVAYGHPLDAIDHRKRDRLWRLARAWMDAHPERRFRTLRIDAIAVIGDGGPRSIVEHLRGLR